MNFINNNNRISWLLFTGNTKIFHDYITMWKCLFLILKWLKISLASVHHFNSWNAFSVLTLREIRTKTITVKNLNEAKKQFLDTKLKLKFTTLPTFSSEMLIFLIDVVDETSTPQLLRYQTHSWHNISWMALKGLITICGFLLVKKPYTRDRRPWDTSVSCFCVQNMIWIT